MSGKTLLVVLVVAAILFCGVLSMHGKGHQMVAKWMPALHGGGGR